MCQYTIYGCVHNGYYPVMKYSIVSIFYVKREVDSCPASSLTFDHPLFLWLYLDLYLD